MLLLLLLLTRSGQMKTRPRVDQAYWMRVQQCRQRGVECARKTAVVWSILYAGRRGENEVDGQAVTELTLGLGWWLNWRCV